VFDASIRGGGGGGSGGSGGAGDQTAPPAAQNFDAAREATVPSGAVWIPCPMTARFR